MSELFDEAEADAIVAANIKKYKSSSKEGSAMHFINTPNGVQKVVQTDKVERQELVEAVEEAKKQLEVAEKNLKTYDEFVSTESPTGTDVTPEPQPEVPTPEQPVPTITTPVEPPVVSSGGTEPTTDKPSPVIVQ